MTPSRRDLLLALCAVGLGPRLVWAEAPAPKTLSELLGAFGKLRGMSARYVETKTIELMSEPIVNRGQVYYQRPMHFSRFVEHPFPSAVAVVGKQLRLWDGRAVEQIPLSAHPAVSSVVNAFVVLLRGSESELEALFAHHFEVDERGSWQLRLVPKGKLLKKLISKLSFSGRGLLLNSMTVREATGDKSVTSFEDVRLHRVFSKQEQKRLLQLVL